MIYTTCGHNQISFRDVMTIQVRNDPPKYVHLCRKCYESSTKYVKEEND